jgi:hypothetical protein
MRSAVLTCLIGVLVIEVVAAQAPAPGSRPKKQRADPVAEGHAAALKALVGDLQDLAALAERQKLDRERAQVLELVLVFEPDNAAVREALGWVKSKGGAWERSPKWREPGNRDVESLGDFRKKRAEVGGAFLDAMTKVLEENARDLEPAQRARIVGDMNAIDATDPRTKAANGEAQAGGKWVLAETAGAAARRKQLQGFAKTAIRNAGQPQPAEIYDSEKNWDVKWLTCVETENYRVLGTGSKEETTKIAILCQAAGELFAKTFGVDIPHQAAFHTPIYVLASANDKVSFIRANKSIKPQEKERLQQLGGFWVDGAVVQCADDSPARIDGAVRQIVGSFMGRMFGIDGSEHGALYEGVGIHLSWYLTNTRLTWTIGRPKYAVTDKDPLAEKLKGDGADWFGPAYDTWSSKTRPPLKPLLAKRVNDITTEDMIASFGFAVWLVDGRKNDAPRFLRRAGRNEPEDGAKDAFGLELPQLEERLGRWAKEMKSK